MYEIYVDVLVCTNIFINYFILLAISRLSSFSLNRLRIIAGAVLGGIFSLLILLPEINFYINLITVFTKENLNRRLNRYDSMYS